MSEENKMKKERKQQLVEWVLLSSSIGVIVVCCGMVGMFIGVYLYMESIAWLSLFFSIAGIILIGISILIAVNGLEER